MLASASLVSRGRTLAGQAGRIEDEMAGPVERRLLLCYLSGLDLRRIDATSTAFLSLALGEYPWVPLTNLPSNELFPTLVTGVSPSTHGVWGVKLRTPAEPWLFERVWCRLPDTLTTTIQCGLHLTTKIFDLAAVPPRRRNRFEITRTKYKRRNKRREAMFGIGGVPTLFDVVGHGDSVYQFSSSRDPVRDVLPRVCAGGHALEVLELYSLDRHQQWNLDRPDEVRRFYTVIDDFLHCLHEKCATNGVVLALVSDHGHEPIRGAIDLPAILAELKLDAASFTHFVEVSSVRFWFHDEKARRTITERLTVIENASLIGYRDMERYGVPLRDSTYGEAFLFLDPGHIFFPHDFHQPLANLWLGLSDPMQRSRLRDPRHKGNHGHLPDFEAERSFLAVLDSNFETAAECGDILDVAPSILSAIEREAPSSMTGRSLFRHRPVQTRSSDA